MNIKREDIETFLNENAPEDIFVQDLGNGVYKLPGGTLCGETIVEKFMQALVEALEEKIKKAQ